MMQLGHAFFELLGIRECLQCVNPWGDNLAIVEIRDHVSCVKAGSVMGKPRGQTGALLYSISLMLALGANEAMAFQEQPIVVVPQSSGAAVAAPEQGAIPGTPPSSL
jgi:hypothetical protein